MNKFLIILFLSFCNLIFIVNSSLTEEIKVKIGLLIPLFTANAELYLFVAFLSWFLIGSIETYYLKNILNRNIQ